MTLHRTHFEGHDGLRLEADIGGDPDAPAVIFLHGGGQTRHSWGKAAREMIGKGYQAIALDLRGHGGSAWSPSGDYSIGAFVEDVKRVAATFDKPPALVGASLGGVASLLAVGQSESPVASALVLVDVVSRMSPQGIKHIGDFMRGNPDGFASVDEAADAVARYLPNRPRPSSSEGLLKNLRLRDDGRYYWHWDPAFQRERTAERTQAMLERMETAARRVEIPTLLVRGKQSEVVTPEGARLLLELIPHAEFIDVDGAGHMVAGDKNDLFNDAVERFLGRVTDPAHA